MLQVSESRVRIEAEDSASQLRKRHCAELLSEWSHDLTAEEQEIWLWNASVELYRIKRRRAAQVN